MTVFSKQLQKLRKSKLLTQEALAEKLEVSSQAISKWENGSYPDADFIPKIAEFFEVPIDVLYGKQERVISLEEQVYKNFSSINAWTDKTTQQQYFDEFMEFFWAGLNGSFAWKDDYQNRPVIEADAGSVVIANEGLVFQCNRKENEFAFLAKKPPVGFKVLFDDKNELAKVFAFLSDTEHLKILEYMFSIKNSEVVKSTVIATKLGIPKEKVEAAFEFLLEQNSSGKSSFSCINILDENDKTEKAYSVILENAVNYLMLLTVMKVILKPSSCFAPMMIQIGKDETLV